MKRDIRIFQSSRDNRVTLVIWGMTAQIKAALINLLFADVGNSNLRQDIQLYEDEGKTTIVCWGLSEQTKVQLATILLGDVQAVEEITGVEYTSPDFGNDVPSVSGMKQVLPAGVTPAQPVQTPAQISAPAPAQTPDFMADIINLDIPSQIDALCARYGSQNSQQVNMQIAMKIKELSAQVYDMDENSLRMVLFALRNLAPNSINQMVNAMQITEPINNRDQLIIKALGMASRDTLRDTLYHAMNK